jgi:hypothetical protein
MMRVALDWIELAPLRRKPRWIAKLLGWTLHAWANGVWRVCDYDGSLEHDVVARGHADDLSLVGAQLAAEAWCRTQLYNSLMKLIAGSIRPG